MTIRSKHDEIAAIIARNTRRYDAIFQNQTPEQRREEIARLVARNRAESDAPGGWHWKYRRREEQRRAWRSAQRSVQA